MPKKVRARPSRTAPPDQTTKHGGATRNSIASRAESRPEKLELTRRKLVGTCPVCGSRNLDVTVPHVGCWKCEAGGLTSGDYLREVARTIGCTAPELLANPLKYLAEYLDPPSGATAPRESLNEGSVGGWHSRVWTTEHALTWLHERGLTDETIAEYKLGHDKESDAITIPVYEAGELVGVKRRYLDPAADPKTKNTPGQARLYPSILALGKPLLVAGELDALIGRQMGLPTVTTTCGVTMPKHLAPAFNRRHVFVMFDVGETRAAVKAATRVLAYGAQSARVIELEKLGLAHGGDLNDLYLAGGTADDVKALIRRVTA